MYNIDDLVVQANFEKVAYLLWFGKLPNQSELINLHTELDHHAVIPEYVLEHIKWYPSYANTMAVLRTVIFTLSFYDKQTNEEHYASHINKVIALQAKVPTIVATFARPRAGKK